LNFRQDENPREPKRFASILSSSNPAL
jgi:hypothetical protein